MRIWTISVSSVNVQTFWESIAHMQFISLPIRLSSIFVNLFFINKYLINESYCYRSECYVSFQKKAREAIDAIGKIHQKWWTKISKKMYVKFITIILNTNLIS